MLVPISSGWLKFSPSLNLNKIEHFSKVSNCRWQIDDFRFMEVARAAQALAPRVALLF
jgi:hypothetical protein